MHKTSRHLLMLVTLLTLTLSLIFTGGQVFAKSKSPVATSGQINLQAAKVHNYWTPERMKAARPIEEKLQASKQNASATFAKPASAKGAVGSAPPVAPKKSGILPAAKVGIQPAATPIPVGSYGQFPYSTVGKVFFTDSQTGSNYVCSGAAITSANKNTVDTAGHCVVDGGSGGNWYTNWSFCPQYNNGSSPYGCWTARQLFASSTWVNSGSFAYDLGEAVLNPNSSGNLTDVVGAAGYKYNISVNQRFTALGYPQGSPFNGKTMQSCNATGVASGSDIYIACDLTGGSSGGPWMISSGGTFGYINGHNDYKYNNNPNRMYSPTYDNDWYTVYSSAQGA